MEKNYPKTLGNIGRKCGSFIEISSGETKTITSYNCVESSLRKISKSKPMAEKPIIMEASGTGTYFDNINTHKQKQLINNVLDRGGLWKVFIEEKKMTSEDFKKHSDFKPKAIAGFMHFLRHSGLATRFGNVFTINEAAIPHIKKLIKSLTGRAILVGYKICESGTPLKTSQIRYFVDV